jgi:hypothetical protein
MGTGAMMFLINQYSGITNVIMVSGVNYVPN